MFQLIKSSLFVALLLIVFAMVVGSCEESQTLSDISSGEGVNMPPLEGIVSARQKDFVQRMIEDIVRADTLFSDVKAMPTASAAEKARKSRATDDIYESRRKLWAELTTPLTFNDFTGVITRLREDSGFGSSSSLQLTLRLFESGIELELRQKILKETNKIVGESTEYGKWEILENTGDALQWFDLNEGDAVAVSGSFVRYSEKNKWVHCCVASSSWPKFRVMTDRINRLKAHDEQD